MIWVYFLNNWILVRHGGKGTHSGWWAHNAHNVDEVL